MLFIVQSNGQETVLDTDTLQVWHIEEDITPAEQVGPLANLVISQFRKALGTHMTKYGRLVSKRELAEYAAQLLPVSCRFSWSHLQANWTEYLSPQPSAAPAGQ